MGFSHASPSVARHCPIATFSIATHSHIHYSHWNFHFISPSSHLLLPPHNITPFHSMAMWLMSPLPTFFPSRHRFLLTYLSFLCHWQQQLPPLVHAKNVATMTAPIHLHIVLPPAIDINIHTLPLLPPLTIPLIPP